MATKKTVAVERERSIAAAVRPATRARSAETGKIVTKAEAAKSPKTTVIEKVTKPKKVAVKEVKIPKTFGAVADMLYETREQRLLIQKQVDALADLESKLRSHLIENLSKADSTGAAGKRARAQIVTEDQPVVENWPETYKYIKKTGNFDLLNRALNRSAVKARWDNGKQVPGVGHYTVIKVSVTKI